MRSSNTPGTKKSSSDTFLKTTTWGALIAFTLIASAGYYVHDSRRALGSQDLVLEPATAQTSDSPVQAPDERNAARTSRTVESNHPLSATTVWGAQNGNRPSLPRLTGSAVAPHQADLSRQEVAAAAPSRNSDVPSAAVPVLNESAQKALAAKLSPELREIDPEKQLDVIVQFRELPTESHFDLVRQQGGVMKASLQVVNAATFTVQGSALQALAARNEIAYISPDRPVRGAIDTTVATVNGAYARTLGLDGAGIGVALIDSGVSDIPDLHNASGYEVTYAQSFVPTDSSSVDKFGHGTHVSGIIGGTGANSA